MCFHESTAEATDWELIDETDDEEEPSLADEADEPTVMADGGE